MPFRVQAMFWVVEPSTWMHWWSVFATHRIASRVTMGSPRFFPLPSQLPARDSWAQAFSEHFNMSHEPNPYRAPEGTPPPYMPADSTKQGDATGGVIPYKNPKALIAYYLGILSGLPLIGLPFGMAAFVLGILGLRDRRRNPVIKGSIHAGIGIGCGGIFTLLWGFIVIAMIASMYVK